MDLGAYARIETLSHIMTENNIYVPRLRGIRLMSEEERISAEEIEQATIDLALDRCERACQSNFEYHPTGYTMCDATDKLRRKYIVYDNKGMPTGIRWNKIHGKKRKLFKYIIKSVRKRVLNNYETFNKYCGQTNILYIHARIGGGNWSYYGAEVKDQPWFIEKVDDPFDSTYCDIYAIIK